MTEDAFQIIVATFPTEDGAKKASKAIKKDKVKRGNVAIISKTKKGKIHVKESHDWGGGKGALAGAALGAVIPVVGMAIGALAGGVIAKMKDGGFPNDTLKEMGKNLEPEHSMLAMVVDYSAREQAESDLKAAGGQIVSHTLDVRMAQELDEAVAADHADDLTIIEGVGPKIMERLNENGINTFAELADTDVERLRAILAEGGSQFRLADPASWPRQASLAADRDWVRLAALKQEMVGGVR